MKGKMNDKLNGRSRAVLDALREGRHAPVLRTPAPSPAPETRPCVICESTLLTAERVRRNIRELSPAQPTAPSRHQVRLQMASDCESHADVRISEGTTYCRHCGYYLNDTPAEQ